MTQTCKNNFSKPVPIPQSVFDPTKYGRPTSQPSHVFSGPRPVVANSLTPPPATTHTEVSAPHSLLHPVEVNPETTAPAASIVYATCPTLPTSPVENSTPPAITSTVHTARPVPRLAENVNTSGLKFSAWPVAETRARAPSQKRTVILSGLPPSASLADLSGICAKTGVIERFEFKDNGKALVHFIDQQQADQFLARTANGLEYKKKVIFVDPSNHVDVLSGRIREAIERGARRIIRIVGIEDIKQLKMALKELEPSTDLGLLQNKSEDQVLHEMAVSFGAFDVQLAAVRKNAAGYKEGRMVFGKIDTAMRAYNAMRQLVVTEGCNITFGDDPCET
ncbi:hypothetical protein BDD12DRAFT_809197 [Trichophaea hybrida]|nr:hypothetical protein BDD12DRAFT_809197 [Trichophaea hybrida]